MLATVIIIKLVAIALYWFVRLARRSTVNSLPALADRRGWRYQAQADLPRPYRGGPFGRGSDRVVQNMLTGTHRGRTMAAFEYAFVSGMGRKRETEVYTVVAVDTPGGCPVLEVGRDGAVNTADDRFSADVLCQATLDWMADDERAKAFAIRFEGDTLLGWEPGMLDIGRMLALLDYLCDHAERVPARAWR